METKILSQLKSDFEYMSAVEKKIASKILENPEKFIGYSMTELASEAKVSQGSIINFSNKFAGNGFPVLKMKIAACLNDYQAKPFNFVEHTDGLKEIFKKVNENLFSALQNTFDLNSEERLKKVADKILQVKKVEIYGIFRSAVVATDLYYQLLQLGIPVSSVADVLTCAISASMLDSDSLFIAVSASGQTKDVLDAVKIAHENGVFVVGFTSNKDSLLAKLSDEIVITSPSGNSLSNSAAEIRFSQLAVIDTLCAYLRNKLDETGRHYFKINDILNLHNVKD